MERNRKGLLFFVAVAAFLAFSHWALAEDVSIADLGVENTGILPSNPFYFFKEWGRNIRKTLSFGDLNKADLQLNILNEQAAEIKKLNDIGSNNFEGFEKALVNYEYNASLLRERLVALKGNPNTGKLLDNLLDRALKHQEILNELYSKFKSEEKADDFYNNINKSINSLSDVVAYIPGNIEDGRKFRDRFQLAVLKQRGELREFLAAEFIDRFEGKVSKTSQDEVTKLKDDLLLKWSGKLQGMRIFGAHSSVTSASLGGDVSTIRSIENTPGGLKQRLNILDEIREKVGDSDVKNQLGIIRQKLLDKAKEENSITETEVRDLIDRVKAMVLDIEDNLPKDLNERTLVREFLDKAHFNLESAESFFAEGAYGSAYGAAVSASAAAKSALGKLAVKSSDYLDELKNIKEYYDALLDRALKSGMDKDSNPKLFSLFSDAENQIAKISDLINKGSESLKIDGAIRELKLLLGSIEQIIEGTGKPASAPVDSRAALAGNLPALNSGAPQKKAEPINSYTVSISNGLFVPSVLKIKKGDQVIWQNKDSGDHWIAGILSSDAGGLAGFDSQRELRPGESYAFTFYSIGVFKYNDRLNHEMVGIINVE